MSSPLNQQSTTFVNKARQYWSAERLQKLTSGHKYHVLPTNAPLLLRELGLLNKDASMSADSTRKFIQVNHLLTQFKPYLEELNSRHPTARILDAGCGSSFLTFLMAWAYQEIFKHQSLLVGVDSNETLISKNSQTALDMGVNERLKFFSSSISDINWAQIMESLSGSQGSDDLRKIRPHAVVALHAC